MSSHQKPWFPLFVDLSEKHIVVIGGGKIAQRRIETLLAFTDNLQVVAPEVTGRIRALSESGLVQWIPSVYRPDLIANADLVLAATNDALCNEQVAADCRSGKIPVNTAHRKENCDFYFPAIVIQDGIVAGINAGGLDHRKAKEARERIQNAFRGKDQK